MNISVFEWTRSSPSRPPPQLVAQRTLEKDTLRRDVFPQRICFSGAEEVCVLLRDASGSVIRHYACSSEKGGVESRGEWRPMPTFTLSSFTEKGCERPVIQGASGGLHSHAYANHSLAACGFPSHLPWFEVVPHEDGHIAFGMSKNGHLYADSRLLVKNCTSFVVCPAHLIFTTTTHLLKFVHITNAHGWLILQDTI